jgi:[ribosomal protein S5]-alanine N-acetyltransferase
MKIVLEEVVLRRPEPRDAEQFYAYRNDWDVIRCLGGFSTGYSIKDIHEWIEFHRGKRDEIIWTIAEKESDLCIGHVGLYNIDHRVRSAEFAIMIGDKEWWGKGAGKKVTQAVVDYGFRQLNLHRVYLTVLKTNDRATALYEKLGFATEGVLRDEQFRDRRYIDVIVMGILEHEWSH